MMAFNLLLYLPIIGCTGYGLVQNASHANFTITTMDYTVVAIRVLNTTTNTLTYTGVCFEILHAVCEKYHLNYNLGPTDPEIFGFGRPTGTNLSSLDGSMVGAIVTGKANIAVNEFTMSEKRAEIIDYSTFYNQDRLVLILRNPQCTSINLLQPLSITVWIYRICIFITFVIICYFIRRYSAVAISNVSVSFMGYEMLGSQFTQSVDATIYMNSFPMQVVCLGWFTGTFFLTTAYSSNLKAMFAVHKQCTRVESLSEALLNPDFQLIVAKDSFEHQMLEDGKSDIYKRAWQRVAASSQNLMVEEDLQRTAYSLVRTRENVGMIIAKTHAILYLASKPEYQSDLYIANEPVLVAGSSLIWEKHFAFAEIFDKEIRALTEAGKIYMCI